MNNPSNLNMKTIRTIYQNYVSSNTKTFLCENCNGKVSDMEKCRLDNCDQHCKFYFCRACFIEMMTTDPTIQVVNRDKGEMYCYYCSNLGRAYFFHKNVPCAPIQP